MARYFPSVAHGRILTRPFECHAMPRLIRTSQHPMSTSQLATASTSRGSRVGCPGHPLHLEPFSEKGWFQPSICFIFTAIYYVEKEYTVRCSGDTMCIVFWLCLQFLLLQLQLSSVCCLGAVPEAISNFFRSDQKPLMVRTVELFGPF